MARLRRLSEAGQAMGIEIHHALPHRRAGIALRRAKSTIGLLVTRYFEPPPRVREAAGGDSDMTPILPAAVFKFKRLAHSILTEWAEI